MRALTTFCTKGVMSTQVDGGKMSSMLGTLFTNLSDVTCKERVIFQK